MLSLSQLSWRRVAIALALLLTALPDGRAAENYEYPELLVTPSASERVEREAKIERKSTWTAHTAVQSSALMTTIAGFMVRNDSGKVKGDNKDEAKAQASLAGTIGIGAGLAWIATTTFLSATHAPYDDARKDIKSMPAKTERERLAKERAAEEGLEAPALLASRLGWLSFATNLGVSAYMASQAHDALPLAFCGLSAVTAFAPFVFPAHWESVWKYQQDYKKKIYGPIKVSLLPPADSSSRTMRPAAEWAMQF